MNLLLDTHAFLWFQLDPGWLDLPALAAIVSPGNRVALSAASCWEMAIKQSIGKLTLPGPATTWVPEACSRTGIDLADIDAATALAVGGLPWHHRDPFDRLLIAQAARGWTLVTRDERIVAYDVQVLKA